ncbi:MAG: glycosyltransferase family 2 protein, partial [Natronospirillum sp.]
MSQSSNHSVSPFRTTAAEEALHSQVQVSVVSHGQMHLARLLLNDLASLGNPPAVRLTSNLPEQPADALDGLNGVHTINPHPKGFGSNHNQAFKTCTAPFFNVVNPDVRLQINPFPALLRHMQDPRVGLVAPIVLSPDGQVEDNARRFPTLASLVRKAIGRDDGRYDPTEPSLKEGFPVEWVAGMFMLFRSEAFRKVGGFDDKFHLYYEDVDVCARLWTAGWKVVLVPTVSVVHAAQRASRNNPQHMVWHAASMARYFSKHLGRLPKVC